MPTNEWSLPVRDLVSPRLPCHGWMAPVSGPGDSRAAAGTKGRADHGIATGVLAAPLVR